MNILRLPLIVVFAAVVYMGMPLAAQTTRPAVTRPTVAVAGWKSIVDPAEVKGRPRLDLKLSVPVKNAVKCVTSNRPSLLVAVCDDSFGAKQWSLLNLATGGVTPAFAQKMALDEPVLSPDGQYLATKAGRDHAAKMPAALEVWAMKGGKLLHRLSSGDETWPPTPIGFAASDQLISFAKVNFKTQLQAWDLKTGAQTWQVELERGFDSHLAAVSPGGKFVAYFSERKLTVIETGKGETVDVADVPEAENKGATQAKGLAFSADGLEVAAFCDAGFDQSRLLIWDCATGVLMTDRAGEQVKDEWWARRKEQKVEFFGDGRLLRYGANVIDRESAKSVYTIPQSKSGRGDELLKVIGDDRVLIVSERDFSGGAAYVTVATLPKAEIAKTLAVVSTGGRASDAGLPPLTKADLSGVRVALDAAGPPAWALDPDAPPARAPLAMGGAVAMRFAQAPGGAGEQAPKFLCYAGPSGAHVAVAYHVTPPKDGPKRTVVDRLSLPGGTTVGTLDVPGHVWLNDLSADGKLAVLTTGGDRVDVYSFAAPGPAKPVLAFRPYEADKDAGGGRGGAGFRADMGGAIKFAAVAGPDRLITVSQTGRLILWDLAGAKAIYEMAVRGDGFAFSPTRKQLAFGNGAGVSVIDPLSGQVLASIAGPESSAAHLAFHPSGAKLAHFTTYPYPHLVAYDMATGKALGDATLPKDSGFGQVAWTGAGHVIVGGFLCDLDKHLVVWRYQVDAFGPKVRGQPDERYWAFVRGEQRQPPALVPVVLPHEEAKRATAGMNPNDFLVVRPGTKVSIGVSVTGDAAFQKSVTDALTRHATDAGLVVVPEVQPIQLTASTTGRAARTEQFTVIGRPGPIETVTIPSWDCKLSITSGGQALWEVTTVAGGGAPSFAHLKPGETVQQLVNESNVNPGGGFYTSTPIPGLLAKPLDKLLVSRITLKGVAPVQQ